MYEAEFEKHRMRVVNMGKGWTWYIAKPRGECSHVTFPNEEKARESAAKFLGVDALYITLPITKFGAGVGATQPVITLGTKILDTYITVIGRKQGDRIFWTSNIVNESAIVMEDIPAGSEMKLIDKIDPHTFRYMVYLETTVV